MSVLLKNGIPAFNAKINPSIDFGYPMGTEDQKPANHTAELVMTKNSIDAVIEVPTNPKIFCLSRIIHPIIVINEKDK